METFRNKIYWIILILDIHVLGEYTVYGPVSVSSLPWIWNRVGRPTA